VTKFLREINIKKKMFILVHGLRDFSSWLLGPVALIPDVKQHNMVEAYRRKVAHLMAASKHREKERWSQGPKVTLKGKPLVSTSFHEALPPKGSTTAPLISTYELYGDI
jgi:hypothetical protein